MKGTSYETSQIKLFRQASNRFISETIHTDRGSG